MNRDILTLIASESIKLIRLENGYTQEKMADVLGISKKTLVQIEKGRILANWTTTIAICALFRNSHTLQKQIGDDPIEVIELTVQDVIITPQEKTMGGYIWWKNIEEYKKHRLQQNLLSKHYRILDDENYRLISTFDERLALEKWQDIKSVL